MYQATLRRTDMVFVPTIVSISERHRLRLEEQMLARKAAQRKSMMGGLAPPPARSKSLLKQKHRFLGESAVSRITTQIVVGKSYHKHANDTMAKRKLRAFYRQVFGAIADLMGK